MAVSDSMFLFEVVLENVKSLVASKELVVRADFADIFSLDLKDPKLLNIVMPQPPPAPPEAPAKGKKAKKPPKPKKGKKGAVVEPPPPPEPVIQSGQSVLFASSGEILLATMKTNPISLSLWSKEDDLSFIGSANITWDNRYLEFLNTICNCEKPQPLTVKSDYNIFNEDSAKLMATVTLQIKLTYLEDKISSQFRTVTSVVPGEKKCLYTGIHSKQTSFMCSMKMSEPIEGDESPGQSNSHVESTFVREQPVKPLKMSFADYKNAPATNTTFFSDDAEYCCVRKADKIPESPYRSPKVIPDLEYLADYVTKVIRSCNENMRMLTPRPNIKPKFRATDIDRLCGCNRSWPDNELAKVMKNDPDYRVPCALCCGAANQTENVDSYEIQNIRGPCGKTECRMAKDLRNYIEQLAAEDNKEIHINKIVGPCGSGTCTLANHIQKFIRREGVFSSGGHVEGLPTVCACEDKLRESLLCSDSCDSLCSKECGPGEDDSNCSAEECKYNKERNNTFCVGYCTIQNDNDDPTGSKETHPEFCRSDCSTFKASTEPKDCSQSRCSTPGPSVTFIPCNVGVDCAQTCLSKDPYDSANDSNIEINLDDVGNPCSVNTCKVADQVREYISDGVLKAKKNTADDPCYCDCDCSFGFEKKTTYCGVCGGYEVAGTDLKSKSPLAMPTPPCPIYHKLYDKNKFKLNPDWSTPTESKHKPTEDTSQRGLTKGGKIDGSAALGDHVSGIKLIGQVAKKKPQIQEKSTSGGGKNPPDNKPQAKKIATLESNSEQLGTTKKVGKFTFNYGYKAPHIGHDRCHLPPNCGSMPTGNTNVPSNMGWLWTAEDVPGLKYRPDWRPGATNKKVVNLLRHHKDPGVALLKKKKKELKMKPRFKLEKKPLLTVHKKNGEYKVKMESMKIYPRPRHVSQYPYDFKPPETFLIGRTEEENLKRQKEVQRERRRTERTVRRYIQQSFRNACEQVCMSTFRQALGILEPNKTQGDCPCFPKKPDVISSDGGWSCSCSESSNSSHSETDEDEYTIEFTPPIAYYNPSDKPAGGKHRTSTQYSYLDYRVKIVGKDGNPVPRFFKGPDGQMVCSDLGGFWSPTGEWLRIGEDGYVGPDGRWVPNTFIGPDGQIIDSADGKFQGPDGEWLVIGVDGYVDANGRWVYTPPRPSPPRSSVWKPRSEASWSCFGDVTPTTLAARGIVGHSRDKKLLLERLKKLQAAGENVTIPIPSTVPKSPFRPKKPPKKRKFSERYRCRHPQPSDKGVLSVDSDGNKIYFTSASRSYSKSDDRLRSLHEQGIKICTYHHPCLDSFIKCKEIKQQVQARRDRKKCIELPPKEQKKILQHWENLYNPENIVTNIAKD